MVGDGVSPSEAGEVWHLLDHRFRVPLPLIERDRLARLDLGDYTHVVLVDGRWDELGEDAIDNLRRWLRDGGTVIATQARRLLVGGGAGARAAGGRRAAGGPPAAASGAGRDGGCRAGRAELPRPAYADFDRASPSAW